MLVVTRKPSETIVITSADQEIRVTVLCVKGSQVRIGIDAPSSVTVDREEIHEAKKAGHPSPTAMVDRRPRRF